MQVLRFATRAHIETVFEENHELWGLPLTREQYRDYWFSLFLTPWGSSNFRYMALTEEEDGPLLSTAKLYRFTGSLLEQPVVIAGLGALYTPKEQRTYGFASLLVSEVLEYMQKKRAAFAILYTDIGLPFYERLGFRALPVVETAGPLAFPPASAPRQVPGLEIRPASVRDAAAMVSYHREQTAGSPLTIDRDASYWEFVLFRWLRYWDLALQELARPLALIALRGDRVVAAGFAVATAAGVHLVECGARKGEEDALGAILDRIWLGGLEMGSRSWHGRLSPRAAELDARLQGAGTPPRTSVTMVAPLGSTASLEALATNPDLYLPGLDAV